MEYLSFRDIDFKVVSKAILLAVANTFKYLYCLIEYIFTSKRYEESCAFDNDTWAKVQIYSLSLIFKMWHKPHYRSKTFQQDMLDNLKNVAIPGTGIPLHFFCYNYFLCLGAIFIINPIVCLLGAVNKAWKQHLDNKNSSNINELIVNIMLMYTQHLLHPDDWFSFWRLNSALVSYHSLLLKSKDYEQENKWVFLTTGSQLNVPVSPYITSIGSLVCKNVNIEGGMGIHFYKVF